MKTALWLIALELALVLVILAAANVARAAAGPTIYVHNVSTVVSDAELQNDLPAFQAAVSQDFVPWWGQDATLTTTPTAGAWTVTIGDDSDVLFALGYHEVNYDTFSPEAFVFARTTAGYRGSWTVVFTHELFEMLADPYINTAVRGARRFWAVEVCDPVEDDMFAYTRPSADGTPIPLSDFVTPNWYRDRSAGPWDFQNLIGRPFVILRGGYASYWKNNHWVSKWAGRKGWTR